MQRTPKRLHSFDGEALALTFLFIGPTVLSFPVTIRLASVFSPEVDMIAAGAAFGVAMVISLLMDWARARYVYFLAGGIGLALTMSSLFIVYHFRLWWAFVAGLVVYMVVMGLGAQRAERRQSGRTNPRT